MWEFLKELLKISSINCKVSIRITLEIPGGNSGCVPGEILGENPGGSSDEISNKIPGEILRRISGIQRRIFGGIPGRISHDDT